MNNNHKNTYRSMATSYHANTNKADNINNANNNNSLTIHQTYKHSTTTKNQIAKDFFLKSDTKISSTATQSSININEIKSSSSASFSIQNTNRRTSLTTTTNKPMNLYKDITPSNWKTPTAFPSTSNSKPLNYNTTAGETCQSSLRYKQTPVPTLSSYTQYRPQYAEVLKKSSNKSEIKSTPSQTPRYTLPTYDFKPSTNSTNNPILKTKTVEEINNNLLTSAPSLSDNTRYRPLSTYLTNKHELKSTPSVIGTANHTYTSPYKNRLQSYGTPSVVATVPLKYNTGKQTEAPLQLFEHVAFKKSAAKVNMNFGPLKYYIINFKNFSQLHYTKELVKTRGWSDEDVKALKNTFKKYDLGGIYENLTLEGLKHKIVDITGEDFSKNSAIVIIIMSHGGESSMIYANDKVFNLYDEIIDPISKIKSLVGKPKLIFVEACKGSRNLIKRKLDCEFDALNTNSAGSDILTFYAASEKYVSYSHNSKGSYFTQSLCEKMNEMRKPTNIHEICKTVTEDVKKKSRGNQCPAVELDITIDFYFD